MDLQPQSFNFSCQALFVIVALLQIYKFFSYPLSHFKFHISCLFPLGLNAFRKNLQGDIRVMADGLAYCFLSCGTIYCGVYPQQY